MLTPLALQNADLLRLLDGGWADGLTALGRALEPVRDKSNVNRTLKALTAAGLVDGMALTSAGRKSRELADIAEGLAPMPASETVSPPSLTRGLIDRDPQNPREDFDSDEAKAALSSLADDIADRGLLQNLVVRPHPDQPGRFMLIGGERRWRAIGQLIADGVLPADWPIPVKIMAGLDALSVRLAALSENTRRRDLSPIEEARAFKGLMDDYGLSTAEVAQRTNTELRVVQMRLNLLTLPAADQARMALPKSDPAHLGVRSALEAWRAAKPKKELAKPATPKPSATVKSILLDASLCVAVIELAEKIEAAPATVRGEPGFTRIREWPGFGTPLDRLNSLKAVGLRKDDRGAVFATLRLHGSGIGDWLKAAGLDSAKERQATRDDLLRKLGQLAEGERWNGYSLAILDIEDGDPVEPSEIPVAPIDAAHIVQAMPVAIGMDPGPGPDACGVSVVEDRVPLLTLRRGDIVHKYAEGATTFRLLDLKADGETVAFTAQPIRHGKDYGPATTIPLNSIVGFRA